MKRESTKKPLFGLRVTLLRAAGVLALLLLAVCAAAAAAVQFYLFPLLENHKDELALQIARQARAEVRIGGVETGWSGITPRAVFRDVTLRRRDSVSVTAEIPSLEVAASWKTLFTLEPVASLIRVEAPEIQVALTHFASRSRAEPSPARRTILTGEHHDALSGLERAMAVFFSNPATLHLLNQSHVVVTRAKFAFTDYSSEEPTAARFAIEELRLDKYLVAWDASLAGSIASADIASPFTLKVKLNKPFLAHAGRMQNYHGTVSADFAAVDFAHLAPKVALGRWVKSGVGHAKLTAGFDAGRVTDLSCDFALADVSLHLGRRTLPVELETFSGHIEQKLSEEALSVEITDVLAKSSVFGLQSIPSVKLTGMWEGPRLRHIGVSFPRLDLTCLDFILDRIPEKDAFLTALSELELTGAVTDFRFRSSGKLSSPAFFEAAGSFTGVSAKAGVWRNASGSFVSPGASDLSGSFRVGSRDARITLDSGPCALVFPEMFRNERLDFERLSAQADISYANRLAVDFSRLAAANDGDEIDLTGYWHEDDTPLGTLKIEGKILSGHAEHVWRYIPLVAGGLETNDWLMRGLRAGTGRDMTVSVYGPVHEFPHHNTNPAHRFVIEGEVRGAEIDYVPTDRMGQDGRFVPGEWPLLTDIDGRIRFEGMGIEIAASKATTFGVQVSGVTASIPGYDLEGVPLIVSGKATAPLDAMARYLEASPVGALLGHTLDRASGGGDASLELNLRIPLLAPEKTEVAGSITFAGNALLIAPAPPLTDLSGRAFFTERGLSAESLAAKVLDVPVRARIRTDEDAGIVIEARAEAATPDAVAYIADNPLISSILRRASGSTAADVTVTIGRGLTVAARSTLEGIAFDAPAPFAKKAGDPLAFSMRSSPCGQAKGCSRRMQAALENLFAMDVDFDAGDRPVSGKIQVGGLNLALPDKGLGLSIALDAVDFRQWAQPFSELVEVAQRSRGAKPFDIDTISVSAGEFVSDEIEARKLSAKASWSGARQTLSGRFSSSAASGSFTFRPDPDHAGRLAFKLDRLHLALAGLTDYARKVELSPQAYPDLAGSVEDFRISGVRLGRLALEAVHEDKAGADLWRIRKLTVSNPAFAVDATGSWMKKGASSETALEVLADIASIEKTAETFGRKGLFSGGSGRVSGSLSWHGAPTEFALASLDGRLEVNVRDGAVVDVDVGATRVFGFLSVSRLMRRLALDFRDITNTLVFESLTATAEIDDGLATTDNFKMTGPQASILAQGALDLKAQKQDMTVTVLPEISFSSPSVALGFLNPVLGVGTFLAQLALSSPLSNALAKTYALTGTFQNPELVEKAP